MWICKRCSVLKNSFAIMKLYLLLVLLLLVVSWFAAKVRADENDALIPPFSKGETWFICQGYNGQISHHGRAELDLSIAPSAAGPTGCNPETAANSAGRVVRAPASGVIHHPTNDADALCINFDRGESLYIAYLENRAETGRIEQGAQIGTVAPPNVANDGYAHIHIQLHPATNCANSGQAPVAFAGTRRFVGNDDLFFNSDENDVNQHKGMTLKHPSSETDEPEVGSKVLDIALMIDSSGSMETNDPQDMRKDAATVFVSTMEDDDKVAIVDFDDGVRVPWLLNFVGGNRDAIHSAIQTIDSSGGTNISLGMRAGYQELSSELSEERPKAAILMTDGQGNYSNEANGYEANGWPVFTVGLSDSVDEELLQRIAEQTGGRYFQLTNPDQLAHVYFDIATEVALGQIAAGHGNVMNQGDIWTVGHRTRSGLASLFFLVTWPGGDISTTLIAPDGTIIDSETADPNVLHVKGLMFEFYRIDNPERGDWSIQMEATELPEDGELVTLQISEIKDVSDNGVYLPLFVSAEAGAASSDKTVYLTWNGAKHVIYKMAANGAN